MHQRIPIGSLFNYVTVNSVVLKFRIFRESYIFANLRSLRRFAKIKPSRNGEITLPFTDVHSL